MRMFRWIKGEPEAETERGATKLGDLGVENIRLKARHAGCAGMDTFCEWRKKIM